MSRALPGRGLPQRAALAGIDLAAQLMALTTLLDRDASAFVQRGAA